MIALSGEHYKQVRLHEPSVIDLIRPDIVFAFQTLASRRKKFTRFLLSEILDSGPRPCKLRKIHIFPCNFWRQVSNCFRFYEIKPESLPRSLA